MIELNRYFSRLTEASSNENSDIFISLHVRVANSQLCIRSSIIEANIKLIVESECDLIIANNFPKFSPH